MKKLVLAGAITTVLAGCGGGSDDTAKPGSGSNQIPVINVGFERSSYDIKEGDSGSSTVVMSVTANKNVENNVTVKLTTEDGQAKNGVDFLGVPSEIVIAKGTRKVDFSVSVVGNTIHQESRDFRVAIASMTGDAMTLVKTTEVATVKIADDDPEPVVQFDAARMTTNEDIGELSVPLTLSRQSAKETLVRLKVTGSALKDTDYSISTLEYKIPPLTTSFKIPVKILKDKLVEGSETIELTLSFVSNGKLGERVSSAVIISGDLQLPDTGVTTFYNNGGIHSKAPDSAHPYQDAAYGLDTNPQYKPNGEAGFVYTKIDNAGNPLHADVNTHMCVYDNHTGLTWEVKDDSPMESHYDEAKKVNFETLTMFSQNAKYLWLNRDSNVNGGSAGGINDKEFSNGAKPYSDNCKYPFSTDPLYSAEVKSTGCTTEQQVKLYNRAGICGFKDWRVPSISELATIVSYQAGNLVHDPYYLKDASTHIDGNSADIKYWSSTPSVDNTASAWCLDAKSKQIMLCNKQSYHSLRLVRGPKL